MSKITVSYNVCVNGQLVEGEADFSQAELVEVDSLDGLLKGIQQRLGVNCDVNLFVWRANYSA